ncbi:MarR family winged helix-turn-helix transcriptional regulator [Chloroflexota bacterium]
MAEDKESNLYDGQITAVVHGFSQVWNKLEATLSRELAQIQENLDGIRPGRESHPNANYELFYRVSNIISQKGNPTMGELSSALSVPMSTATRIADWLVDNGYIQRLPDAEDRRVVRVALTDLGRELHKTVESYIRQRVQQILACLTVEERTKLITLIGKVVSVLKEITT